MTPEEISKVLSDSVDDPKTWKVYKALFDNEVASDKKVKMMRSILTMAGPIQDGNTRYENIVDRKEEQNLVVADTQLGLDELTESGEAKYGTSRKRVFGRLLMDT